jgi:phosphatidylglycerophosphatase A
LNQFQSLSDRLGLFVATFLGAGLMPKAPGTMGSLATIPLLWVSLSWSVEIRIVFWVGIFLIGTWASGVVDKKLGAADSQIIVIDEVVGMGITGWFASPTWSWMLAVFIVFRFFDILKIPPVRQVDLWSKNRASTRYQAGIFVRGLGPMLDDSVAGIQGLIVLWFLKGYL